MSPQLEQILQAIDQLPAPEQLQILHHLTHRINTTPPISKTPGVVGGDACIANSRIPVWEIIQYRQLGASDHKILEAYPQFTKQDLQAAWEYNDRFPEEIALAITANEAA